MKSWRINVERRDRSGTVVVNTNVTGAMTIRASKGTTKPVLINTGDEKTITDIFGIPGAINASGVAGYADVWEAIEYNRVGPIWISAPPVATDTMGGVFVLESGVVPFTTGVTEAGLDSFTFSDVEHSITEEVGIATGTQTEFSKTLDFSIDNPLVDLDIRVDGTTITPTVTGTAPNYVVSASALTLGSYNSTTKVLSLTFGVVPSADTEVTAVYSHTSTPYFALLSYSPSENDLKINSEWDNVNKWFNFSLYRKNPLTLEYEEVSEFSGSKSLTKLDGFGASKYIENTLADNVFVRVLVNNAIVAEPSTNFISEDVLFNGGSRSLSIGAVEIASGWSHFQNSDAYNASIFMDPTYLPSVVPIFDTLSKNYQLYKSFIVKLPMGLTASTAVSTKAGFGLDNSDVVIYYNNAKVINTYTGLQFWTSLVGRIGQKYALMSDIYNAGAPSWFDEDNHGGQLGAGIVELERTLTEDELKTLDDNGVNPITFKPAFGPMIEGQKTAKTPTVLSDYSYVAHARLFNYIISNLVDNVLHRQIHKLNDENHRLQRKTEAELIVNPILSDGYLRELAIVCDSTNNTDAVLARREFILDVVVKVTTYSERIKLRFTNVGQTTSVTSIIG